MPEVLQNFFIDTVYPVEGQTHDIMVMEQEDPVKTITDPATVQLVRYSVIGTDAEDAVRRFIEEDAGVEVERTEPTDFVIIGIAPGSNPFG